VSVHTAHYDHVLGTSLDLRVVANGKSVARRAEAELLAEVDRLEPILSGWSESSEFARWQATFDVPVPVSPELAEVLDMCEAWRLRTRGAFDPVASLAQASDSDRLRWVVDRANGTARRMTGRAASLDAIAKGYIVSRAARHARDVDGVTDVLLNIGGDVQHFGEQDVAVGVGDPFAPADNSPPVAVVRIRNAALATSGAYRRGPHILDPRTGLPANRIASASVLAPDCATADALSTAFSVMTPDESVALANAILDVGCMLIEADGTVTTNAAWNARAVAPRAG
jgi:thiamine biosynthesis lipoprotein